MLSIVRYSRFVLLVTTATMLLAAMFIFGQEALTTLTQWLLLLRLLLTVLAIFALNYALRYGRNPVQAYLNQLPTLQNRACRLVINLLVALAIMWLLGWFVAHIEGVNYPAAYTRGNEVRYHLRLVFFVLLMYMLFELDETGQRVARRNEVLQREQSVARFEALKQQLSPHFLFNSFATLQWLIRADADAAERFLQQMAQVYRYVLHQGEQQRVTLGEELAFVDAYLYLLHMRFEHSLRVEMAIPAELHAWHLPPLAIQTVVENAVKHNIVSPEQPLTIQLRATPGALVVRNTLQLRLSPEPSSGIGLRNLGARFRFLGAAGLTTSAADGYFTVTLPLFA